MNAKDWVGVMGLFAVAALGGCWPPPETGPDVRKATDEQLEKYEGDCFRFGRHGRKGARYTEEYCAQVTEERAHRLYGRKADP
jgi:hypothetical protein